MSTAAARSSDRRTRLQCRARSGYTIPTLEAYLDHMSGMGLLIAWGRGWGRLGCGGGLGQRGHRVPGRVWRVSRRCESRGASQLSAGQRRTTGRHRADSSVALRDRSVTLSPRSGVTDTGHRKKTVQSLYVTRLFRRCSGLIDKPRLRRIISQTFKNVPFYVQFRLLLICSQKSLETTHAFCSYAHANHALAEVRPRWSNVDRVQEF